MATKEERIDAMREAMFKAINDVYFEMDTKLQAINEEED